MSSPPRIVFYGTPDFAVASLDAICGAGYRVVAVVTAPDRPAGRGLKERPPAVKSAAVRLGLPVLQPVNLKDPAFAEQLESFGPDLQVVIAFRMMPRSVWDLPPMGTINLHASLLPQYRGAAPINHAIINGERQTGVTTFFINDRIDTGAVLLSERLEIGPDETAGELHDRLMVAGAALVLKTIALIAEGQANPVGQDSLTLPAASLKTAPKIFPADCRIKWEQDVARVHNFIRGLSPHPGAYTELVMADGSVRALKIFRSTPLHDLPDALPGKVFTDGKELLAIAAAGGWLRISELQMEGRKALSSADFLRGYGRILSETRAI